MRNVREWNQEAEVRESVIELESRKEPGVLHLIKKARFICHLLLGT